MCFIMKIEFHKARLRESIAVLEFAIEKGLASNQRTVGFSTSSGSVDLLSMYFFQERLVSTGTQINHSWLKSKKRALEMMPFDFPNKERIVELMVFIESKRDAFCYGVDQKIEDLRATMDAFQDLRTLFRSMGVQE